MSKKIEEMNHAELKIALIQANKANEALKQGAKADTKLTFKVSDKGCIVVYGLGRFPTSLYKKQWMRLFAQQAELEEFLKQVPDDVAVKPAGAEITTNAEGHVEVKKAG